MRRRIQPEEMRRRFLQRAEVDSVRPPRDQFRVFVEAVGQNLRRAAFRRDHGDLSIQVVKVFRAVGRLIGDLFAVRRPHRIRVRPRSGDDLLRFAIGKRHHIDVPRVRGDQVRIALRAERDPRSVRRPGKIPSAEITSFRHALRLRKRSRRIGRQINGP